MTRECTVPGCGGTLAYSRTHYGFEIFVCFTCNMHYYKKIEKEPDMYVLLFRVIDPASLNTKYANADDFYALQGNRKAFTNKEDAWKKAREIALAKPEWEIFVTKVTKSVRAHTFDIKEY